jgi:hypothetical protein
MTEEHFRTPPEAVDMGRAEQAIRKAGLSALLLTGLCAGASLFSAAARHTFSDSSVRADRLCNPG